ncbi:unnamed protein product [Fusarium graminearum]|uniref:Chromosome 4, complete genome n=2 Tax=Gibberella zeae TaxID=5518 RepID=I1RSG4_GIBZE|nr:hypothetical protein FGSG_07082 [Fusarium graminearum PH-1]ESU13276.1 hypothetical protein FGSG_07082 [Fusarium graminearum PH-1]CEF83075.1 unnamed protein product [Fusarium graminearum]CZS72872.1 unnamed protein product [Fusarium graminearum]|eukprot:XP_011326783.1 hypothetical protein FGSG_07082 [Fusarium graminearum PH-1]
MPQMADRRPALTLPLPDREQSDFQRPQSSLQTPPIRSPRFREDFDAPFSVDIMNASRITLATDTMSYPSTGTNSRNSFGYDETPPQYLRNASWESETKRRSKVNDRILEWAKKSWGAVRTRSDSKFDYFDSHSAQSPTSDIMSPSSENITPSEPDGSQAANDYTRAVTVTVMASSKAGSK